MFDWPAAVGAARAPVAMPPAFQASKAEDHLGQQDAGEAEADRPVAGDAGAKLGEIDVEHHHHEQEQHRDRAVVDDDQKEGEKLGPDQQEQPRRVEKRGSSQSTLCTGLRDAIVITPEAMTRAANR